MLLQHQVPVALPPKKAFELFSDLSAVASCLPGATLTGSDGDEHLGQMKIKVGPITAQYEGRAVFVDHDPTARRAVIAASGSDSRGQGTANATITIAVTADGDGALVDIETDLAITGKVAQFGRGVITDISNKLLETFSQNLRAAIEGGGVEKLRADEAASAAPAANASAASSPATGRSTIGAAADAPNANAELDLGGMAMQLMADRAQIVGIAALALAFGFLLGRQNRRR